MERNTYLLITNLLYQLYNEPDFINMQKTLLMHIKMLIPYTYGCVFIPDHKNNSGNMFLTPVRYPEDYPVNDSDYLEVEEADYCRWIIYSGQSQVIRESDLLPEDTRVNTVLYQKCYASCDLHYSVQLSLFEGNKFLGLLMLYRSKKMNDFTDEEIFYLNSLKQHLNSIFNKFCNYIIEPPKQMASLKELAIDYNLTNREAELLKLIFKEYDNEFIANHMNISQNTLKKHLQNLYKKFNVTSRWSLLKFK